MTTKFNAVSSDIPFVHFVSFVVEEFRELSRNQ